MILLDYSLPDVNGLEFIKQLQEQGDNLPPIIMLTGQENDAIVTKAMKSRIHDYLVKDKITPETLSYCVNNVLNQHNLNTSLAKNKQQQKLTADIALRIRQSLNL